MRDPIPSASARPVKQTLITLAAVGLIGVGGGLLFAWSGLFSVAASSDHWPITTSFLEFALRNSVETHAIALNAPPLEDLAKIERGAGHYETGCAPCHGAPGSPGNAVPKHMLPEPPYLPAVVESWSAEQLFWIVKHGLKFTGMPAWPAQNRDDEVWAVTAFLQKLPGMEPRDYSRLARGAVEQVPPGDPAALISADSGILFPGSETAAAAACVRCHGVDGTGRPSGAFPRLDIQEPAYLLRALTEYASGIRPSGIMEPVAAALEPDQMERLAQRYSRAGGPSRASPSPPDPDMLDLGRAIALSGIPDRQIAPCSACHGLQDGSANDLFPTLNGQHAEFTSLQLQLWKDGKRGGSAYSRIMEVIVRNLAPNEIQAVALFYESLPTDARPVTPAAAP